MGHLAVPLPAVFDTSIFVGQERRGLGVLAEWAPVVSVITVAELSFGVAAAARGDPRPEGRDTDRCPQCTSGWP